MTSRASPCCTSTRTVDDSVETSSPRPIDRGDAGAEAQRIVRRGDRRLLRLHENVSGWLARPSAVHRLSVADSDRSLTNPPVTVRSTPPRGSVSVARDNRRRRRRQRDRLGARPRSERQRDLERQDGAARRATARHARAGLRRARPAGRRGAHRAPSVPRERALHPAFPQAHRRHEHAAGNRVARAERRRRVDAQVVVDARQRGINGRRRRRGASGLARARSARYSSTGRTTQPSAAGACARVFVAAHRHTILRSRHVV